MMQIQTDRPCIFSVRCDEDVARLIQTVRSSAGKRLHFFDFLEESLKELFQVRHPRMRDDLEAFDKAFPFFLREYTKGRPLGLCGAWVLYPWSSNLVHTLEQELFEEVRTARNKNLITHDEQRLFRDARIAVVGLSVGSHAALTIAMQGGSVHMIIADHDAISLSNLNRIRGGIQLIGVNKCQSVARQIYEMNPYAHVQTYERGIQEDMVDMMYTNPGKITLLIEETDDMRLKIRIRQKAKSLRIPVISAADNGDGILLDIERFDIDPSLPILRGRADRYDLEHVDRMNSSDLAACITDVIDPADVTPRMQASVEQVGTTLCSWPQLGNAAQLAGSALAYAARMIATGGPLKSGRTIISFEKILSFSAL